MITWVLDALLAFVYLKWFHPWRIILQEEPDLWEPETEDEVEQDEEQVEDGQIRDAVAVATAQDSPLSARSGHRVDVELDDCTPSHQVDTEINQARESEKNQ